MLWFLETCDFERTTNCPLKCCYRECCALKVAEATNCYISCEGVFLYDRCSLKSWCDWDILLESNWKIYTQNETSKTGKIFRIDMRLCIYRYNGMLQPQQPKTVAGIMRHVGVLRLEISWGKEINIRMSFVFSKKAAADSMSSLCVWRTSWCPTTREFSQTVSNEPLACWSLQPRQSITVAGM